MFDDARREQFKNPKRFKRTKFSFILIQIISKFPLWGIAVEVTKMTMKNIPQKSSKEFQIHPTHVSKRKFQAKQFLDLFHKILRNFFYEILE